MIQKQKLNSSEYISCIRIKGIPILPPLITPNKKKKLLEYKKKAVDVEEKIRERLDRSTFETHCTTFIAPSPETVSENVPCLNLTCDLVEASEYSSSGIRFFNDKISITEQCNNTHGEDLHESRNCCSPCDEHLERTAPPLIRSNSYTLESPSPLLLAHLKSMGLESSFGDEQQTFQTLTSPDSAKSNFETENKPFIDAELTEGALLSVETDEKNDSDAQSKTAEEQLNWSDSVDIVPHEGAAENSNKFQLDSLQASPNLEKKTDVVITELDMELLTALNKLALNEKEQILLLLKSHDREQVQIQNSEIALITNHENNISNCSDTSNNFPCFVTETSKFCETKIDILDESDNFITEKTVSNTVVRNILNCSKKLFDDQVWLQERSREELAASIIVAHAKGYLTRRLMTTERVRNLIETIKDALICAMQLHNETTDIINESDVELHRRLVQQISAACYAFYDIFFTLSTAEQMAIIAHDRRRLKEKTLKNLSLS